MNRCFNWSKARVAKVQDDTSNIISRNELIKLKLKAIRAGVWFKALPRIDRVLVDLTIQVANNIRSAYLAKGIFAVASKLEGLLESKFVRFTRTIGVVLVEKAIKIAQSWGNSEAKSWSSDLSFARYLVLMQANK